MALIALSRLSPFANRCPNCTHTHVPEDRQDINYNDVNNANNKKIVVLITTTIIMLTTMITTIVVNNSNIYMSRPQVHTQVSSLQTGFFTAPVPYDVCAKFSHQGL